MSSTPCPSGSFSGLGLPWCRGTHPGGDFPCAAFSAGPVGFTTVSVTSPVNTTKTKNPNQRHSLQRGLMGSLGAPPCSASGFA